MNSRQCRCVVLACCGLAVATLAGCSNNAAPLSKAEEANFKGGPMPPEVQRAMAEHAKKMQSNPPAAGQPQGGQAPSTQ